MAPRPTFLPYLILLLLLLLSGCGYRWGVQPADMGTIGVSLFSNQTFRAGLELFARDLLIRRCSEKGIALEADLEKADSLLEGKVLRYSKEAVAFDADDISRQFRLTVVMEFTLNERPTRKTLWEGTLTASIYYYTGRDVPATQISENRALALAVEEISQQAIAHLLTIR